MSPATHATEPAAAEPGVTCHGRTATIVGTPGTRILGTAGDDVIVSQGARAVRARGGDDVVCLVSDGGTVFVTDGPGDDLVDTRGVTPTDYNYVSAILGQGSDVYLGGPSSDGIHVEAGAGDSDVIRTRGSSDVVWVEKGAAGSGAVIDLGLGADAVDFGDTRTTLELRGGAGRDSIWFACGTCDVTARLGARFVDRDGTVVPARGFEKARIKAREVNLYGGPLGNRLEIDACTGLVDGGAGDDLILLRRRAACLTPVALHGRAGDDRIRAAHTDDLLYGGPGHDVANGNEGEDLCEAEVRRACEL